MPASLLSLSDDTLQTISALVHGDASVPFPSFHPHPCNYLSEIDPVVHKDYLALRYTCRRLRSLCEPRGLHLKLSSMQSYMRWVHRMSHELKNGVRRLYFAVPFPRRVQHGSRADVNVETSTIISSWCTFLDFLRSLPSLEELVIKYSPICQGDNHDISFDELQNPNLDTFPNIPSIALEINCSHCSDTLAGLLLGKLDHLQHLKLGGIYPNYETGVLQPGAAKTKSIRTIALKTNSNQDVTRCLDLIARTYPDLSTLYLSRHAARVLDVLDVLSIGQYFLFASPKAPSKKDWHLVLKLDRRSTFFSAAGAIAMWNQRDRMPNFLETLSKMKHLAELDCLIAIIMDPNPTHQSPEENTKRSERMKAIGDLNHQAHLVKGLHTGLPALMEHFARVMIEHVPTLRIGYFWQHFSKDPRQTERFSYRWTWSRVDLPSGGYDIKIGPVPEIFSGEFMYNRDGEGRWDDDESEEESGVNLAHGTAMAISNRYRQD